MKIKPAVIDHVQTQHSSFIVDLDLENNITFITGDAGTGKSTVFDIIREMAAENKAIRCLNYLDLKKNYKNTIRRSKGKLFIIDNADILLDDDMRWYIATDGKNQYILFGRNPTGLMLSQDEIMELNSERRDGKTMFTLFFTFILLLKGSVFGIITAGMGTFDRWL